MKTPRNYIAAFVLYALISICQILSGESSLIYEMNVFQDVVLTLVLAWAFEKKGPQQFEFVVKKDFSE